MITSAACRRRRSRTSSGPSSCSSCSRSASGSSRRRPRGRTARVLTQIKYLLLPSFCLVFVLFGYIARMARAGTIEALDADYTRTAVIKGLPQRTVLCAPRAAQLAAADDRRHRHAGRLPHGRPRGDRAHLQLPGDRPDDLPRRDAEGLPGARGGGARRRRRLPGVDARGGHPLLGPQPAGPARRARTSERRAPPPSALEPVEDLALKVGRRATTPRWPAASACRCCVHSKSFIAGAIIVGFWSSARSSANCSCSRTRSPRTR